MPQVSKIKLLPPDIRARIDELLLSPGYTQLEIVDIANEMLEALGLPDRVTKSGLSRYKVGADKVGEKIRQQREISQMMLGSLGAKPLGDAGKILNEFVRCMTFETSIQLAEGDEPVHPKILKDLALAVERLERSATLNVKRDEEIRKQEREQALHKISELEKGGSKGKKRIDPETLKTIREEVYGLVG